ncbi:MAG: hypothetical protein JRJ78_13890 [Deltaproteobacteria bacterium]|nr:hypothetical protein [Deltaproteobacteria bacterium]
MTEDAENEVLEDLNANVRRWENYRGYAKEALKSPFWQKLFKPRLEADLRQLRETLMECSLADVKATRAAILLTEAFLNYPEEVIKEAEAQIAVEKEDIEQYTQAVEAAKDGRFF